MQSMQSVHPRRRRAFATVLALLFALSGLLLAGCPAREAESAQLDPTRPPSGLAADRLRTAVEEAAGDTLGLLDAEREQRLHAAVGRFYDGRGHRPAWVGDGGVRAERVRSLLELLHDARRDGLRPRDYEPAKLDDLLDRATAGGATREDLLALELAATRVAFQYGLDLGRGRVEPGNIDATWAIEPPETDPVPVVERAVESGSIPDTLRELAPGQSQYRDLRAALGRLLDTAERDALQPVPEGEVMNPGDPIERRRIAALEDHLVLRGYLEPNRRSARRTSRDAAAASDSEKRPGTPADPKPATVEYDRELADAVRRFQLHHGIETDGLVGAETLRELNVPLEKRIRQVTLNMARWRWLPRELGDPHVQVNVAGFWLELRRGGRAAAHMSVVVGKQGWQTPFFSDRIENIVLSPYWNVPDSIAVDDILPKVREDVSYIAEQRFEVLEKGSGDPVDPYAVDWDSISAAQLQQSYRFRQKPGPESALGEIKFLFPNDYNIYLHDTPADHLFSQTDRAFSHGCIRVEKPYELAELVLRGSEEWDRSRVRRVVESGEHRWIDLEPTTPVYILYWTSWVDDDGRLRFEQDLYGVDETMTAALEDVRSRSG